jgi:hypothetical protein
MRHTWGSPNQYCVHCGDGAHGCREACPGPMKHKTPEVTIMNDSAMSIINQSLFEWWRRHALQGDDTLPLKVAKEVIEVTDGITVDDLTFHSDVIDVRVLTYMDLMIQKDALEVQESLKCSVKKLEEVFGMRVCLHRCGVVEIIESSIA